MNKKILSLVGASLLLFSACQSEDVLEGAQTETNGKTISVTLNATRGEDASTRTAITKNDEYGSLESKWVKGDKIYVYKTSGDYVGYLVAGDVVNQKASTTAEYATSYTTFTGTISSLTDTDLANNLNFVYAGSAYTTSNTDGNPKLDARNRFTINLNTASSVSDLAAWDIAYVSGKLIKQSGDNYTASVSFSNKLAFGYFTTKNLGLSGDNVQSDYAQSVYFDVTTGTVSAVPGTKMTLPANADFYMPLIPGTVNMKLDMTWTKNGEYLGYNSYNQSYSFSATAGKYHRLGKASSYGPVPFNNKIWTQYETTLPNSVFTVASGKQVHFTQGNLRYSGVDKTWRIDSQLDIPSNTAYQTSSDIEFDANQDITLFGWGNNAAPFYCSTSVSYYEAGVANSGSFTFDHDWGYAVSNEDKDGNAKTAASLYKGSSTETFASTKYYTLTSSQWSYLLGSRKTLDDGDSNTTNDNDELTDATTNARYAACRVLLEDGKTYLPGIVIFPDNVSKKTAKETYGFKSVNEPSASFKFTNSDISYKTINEYGLAFLPAAGGRNGAGVSTVGTYGYYWSSTAYSSTSAYNVYCGDGYFNAASNNSRYYGFSVRLVY